MNDNTQQTTTATTAQVPDTATEPQQWEECATRLKLDEATHSQVRKLIDKIGKGDLDESTVSLLSHAVNHDEEVKNAEAEGYLRGRNEKIEQATQPMPIEQEATAPATFPRYRKRSVWDR